MIYFENDFVGKEYNLNYPRVLWNSISRRGTVAVSTEATGYEGVNAATATQSDAWKPTAMPATWTLNFDAVETISAVAIDTHTIGSTGTQVLLQEWDGSAWVDVMEFTPDDDAPIAMLFAPRETDQIRVRFFGSSEPEMAIIHCSDALELPQLVHNGVTTPINMAYVTEYQENLSEQGLFLGRSVRYSKPQNEFNVKHVTRYWVENTLLPFIEDAREYPFFLLESPLAYPESLSYRWRGKDIQPSKMGIRNLMQFTL